MPEYERGIRCVMLGNHLKDNSLEQIQSHLQIFQSWKSQFYKRLFEPEVLSKNCRKERQNRKKRGLGNQPRSQGLFTPRPRQRIALGNEAARKQG